MRYTRPGPLRARISRYSVRLNYTGEVDVVLGYVSYADKVKLRLDDRDRAALFFNRIRRLDSLADTVA